MEAIDILLKKLAEDVSGSPPESAVADPEDIIQQRAIAARKGASSSVKTFSQDLEAHEEEAARNIARLKDPNTTESEKKDIRDWFVETYDSYVRARIKKSLLAYSKFVDPDKLEDAVQDFWLPFLSNKKIIKGRGGKPDKVVDATPAILDYDPSRPFLKYLNAYLNTINDPGYYGVQQGKQKHVRFGGVPVGGGDDDEKGLPEPKAPAEKGSVEQLSMDEKDIAKDVVKALERIVKSGNSEGGISPEQAELFMHTYALGRPFSMEKIKGLLNIKYNPSVAITDMKTKHKTPDKAMVMAGLTGERKKIFQLLLNRIEKLVTGGEKVSGEERNVPDLLTLPTAPMEESIIRLVELLKEWNNVNANVERSA